MFEIFRTCVCQSFMRFMDKIVEIFGSTYLRPSTEEVYRRFLVINSQRGFTGCVGSWVCQNWERKNCFVGWAEQFSGNEEKSYIILETRADRKSWIWAWHFRKPCSLNDIKTSNFLPINTRDSEGDPLQKFEHTVGRNAQKNLYFRIDGIYPLYSIFVSTLYEATTRKERALASAQEVRRKFVDRAFGVSLSCWELLAKLCTVMSRLLAARVKEAAVILHKMVVEARRNGFKSGIWFLAEKAVKRWLFIAKNGASKQLKWKKEFGLSEKTEAMDMTRCAAYLAIADAPRKDTVLHYTLKLGFVDHNWKSLGDVHKWNWWFHCKDGSSTWQTSSSYPTFNELTTLDELTKFGKLCTYSRSWTNEVKEFPWVAPKRRWRNAFRRSFWMSRWHSKPSAKSCIVSHSSLQYARRADIFSPSWLGRTRDWELIQTFFTDFPRYFLIAPSLSSNILHCRR